MSADDLVDLVLQKMINPAAADPVVTKRQARAMLRPAARPSALMGRRQHTVRMEQRYETTVFVYRSPEGIVRWRAEVAIADSRPPLLSPYEKWSQQKRQRALELALELLAGVGTGETLERITRSSVVVERSMTTREFMLCDPRWRGGQWEGIES